MGADQAPVRVERRPPLLQLVLDRDAKRNAVSQPMLRTLTTAVAAAAADPDVRAVLIRGEGRDFCAGEDVRGFDFPDLATAARFLEGPLRLFEALETVPLPVCVAVHGHALGFGTEICLVADLVVAHPQATFGFAEIDHGAVPSVLMTRGLAVTGRRRAVLLALTGRRIPAAEALDAGIVHALSDDPEATAMEAALVLAQYGAEPVALIKRLLGAGALDDHDRARAVMPLVLTQTRAAM